ncbi:MAG: hypothetical protein U9N59_11025, partial [Campylobacterota bacterium]|nr:hypothetical protein [Campylobacterota bacterium]
ADRAGSAKCMEEQTVIKLVSDGKLSRFTDEYITANTPSSDDTAGSSDDTSSSNDSASSTSYNPNSAQMIMIYKNFNDTNSAWYDANVNNPSNYANYYAGVLPSGTTCTSLGFTIDNGADNSENMKSYTTGSRACVEIDYTNVLLGNDNYIVYYNNH